MLEALSPWTQEGQLICMFPFLSLLETDGRLIFFFFKHYLFYFILFLVGFVVLFRFSLIHCCGDVLKPMLRKQSTVKSEPASLCVELPFPCAEFPGMCSFLSGTTPDLPVMYPP